MHVPERPQLAYVERGAALVVADQYDGVGAALGDDSHKPGYLRGPVMGLQEVDDVSFRARGRITMTRVRTSSIVSRRSPLRNSAEQK